MHGTRLLSGCLLILATTVPAAAAVGLGDEAQAAPAVGEMDAETPAPAIPAEAPAASAVTEEAEGVEPAALAAEAAEPPVGPADTPEPEAESAETAEPAAAEPSPTDVGTTGRAEPSYPYTGKITADLVNIRCGPRLYYYPLTTLSKGETVVVESERDGWLALRPPEDLFGLMRKSDLDVGSSGTSAVVTAPEARVYASGPKADRRWCVAGILEKGDRVAVLGQGEGDFLRVALPKEARAYVVEDYVTASAAGAEPSAGTGAETAEVEVEKPEANPLIKAFREADRGLKAEMAKDIGSRDYDAAAEPYQAILEKAEKDYVRRACKERLAYIAGLREQQEDYLRMESLGDTLDERLAEIKTRYADRKAQRDFETEMGRTDFVAQGVVRRLKILEGVDYPIKYKLVDQNNRPLVVLRSTQYDLSDYVGKVVGVRGTRKYVKDWGIYSVTVDDLEVLE